LNILEQAMQFRGFVTGLWKSKLTRQHSCQSEKSSASISESSWNSLYEKKFGREKLGLRDTKAYRILVFPCGKVAFL
jgi:hypothetical protein